MSDDSWNVERFIEAARQIGEGLSVFPVAFATTLADGGWAEPPLDNMDAVEAIELVTRLQGKSDAQIKQELDVAVPAYFRKEDYTPLSEMVSSWKLYFTDHRESVSEDTLWAHHHQVFEDALWAHKKERYTLSIYALAPQFESVGKALMKEYGEKPSSWQENLNKVLDYDPNRPSGSQEILPEFMDLPIEDRFKKAEETIDELNKHTALVRIDDFFEKGSPYRAKAVYSVNRHSIAHGSFRNFVEVESLKLFVVLDQLHRAAGIYRDRRDREGDPPDNKPAANP